MVPDYDRARQAFLESWRKACSIWPKVAAAPIPELRFDLKGRAAGQAIQRGPYRAATIRINQLALAQNPERMCSRTIPHEIAHVVCDITGLGRGHNRGWQRVDRMLGGTGERCYTAADYSLPTMRRTPIHLYRSPRGEVLHASARIHKRIQAGERMRVKATGEPITAADYIGPYREVPKVLTT